MRVEEKLNSKRFDCYYCDGDTFKVYEVKELNGDRVFISCEFCGTIYDIKTGCIER